MSGEPSEARVRPAHIDDLDAHLLRIEEAAYTSPWTKRIFEQEFRNTWSRLELLEVAGEVVAHLVTWEVADELHILNVAVHPDHQRRGFGRRLVNHALDRARAGSTSYVTLEVRASNVAAAGLYDAMGFRRIGVRRRYYQDNGEDAVVMALLLDDEEDST